MRKIRVNRAQCNACGAIIESRHRHDFVGCPCGKTFVDGGREYLRRGYGPAGFTELSEYEAITPDQLGFPANRVPWEAGPA